MSPVCRDERGHVTCGTTTHDDDIFLYVRFIQRINSLFTQTPCGRIHKRQIYGIRVMVFEFFGSPFISSDFVSHYGL